MKRCFLVLMVLFFVSCKTDENKFVKLNEKDAYELINEYFIPDIKRGYEKVIFSEYQYIEPDITVEEIESIKKEVYFPEEQIDEDVTDLDIEIEKLLPPKEWYEKFTKNKWDKEKLNKVSFIKKSHKNQVNDTIFLIDILKGEFGNSRVHHVSYPIYYPKEKIAIIFDEPYDVGYMNCIEQANYHLYLKEGKVWKSLKEYGIRNFYKTLNQYYYKNKVSEK